MKRAVFSDNSQQRCGNQVLAELVSPGRLLAFVDDGGTPGKQIPSLAGNFQVMCAVTLTSQAYAAAKADMAAHDYLQRRGLDEFHATQIVNPGNSGWKEIPITERIEIFGRLFAILRKYSSEIIYGYVSGEQMDNSLRALLPPTLRTIKTKAALERVFFGGFVKHLKRQSKDVGIVMDSDVVAGNCLRIQAVSQPEGIYEGGILKVDSQWELGVQLADLASYTFNYLYHAHNREIEKRFSPFDVPITAGFRHIARLFRNVLELDHE